MTPGRSRLTLAERSALSSAGPADGPPPPGAVDVPADARPAVVRHCWVSGLPETQGRCAGLVAEWVRRDGCWCARVMYAVDDGGAVVLVEAWVSVSLRNPRPG